ncbi:prepilin-type N-terminal cleavage/methylation domain-containing protein [Shewanella sp. SG41-4]|uniref:prepilin-type N-terminal cleavage/methylation domain-containing protein n=1 Tax=Shewanella sp. SG41-4 TaxID=2760976 RepID=UPI0016036ACC|nr:prepilin-type N-terminal cleavage/methylation domain-containing protein [Shewanella sp. SG41-4]MBB1437625.1 prepilin-type N-terminal cleavage/methylation domain-containing protein [Shewanella sp. SG41-4]
MHTSKQRGFTLIELVVVIIILGILAVVAAPKFINLKSDALIASLKGFQGALESANTLLYSKAVLSGQEKLDPGSVTVNGTTISTTLGYITSLSVNVAVSIDGSFEVMTNANDTITADWGLYDVSGGNVYIFPKGYDINGNCSLRYFVDGTKPADPIFYALTTTGC